MAWPVWAIVAVIGLAVGVISFAFAPRPKQPQHSAPAPAGLDEFDFPTATPGRDIPVVFGTRWVEGPNVVWYGDLRTTPIQTTTASGGKK